MNRGPFIFFGVLAIISVSWAIALIKPVEEAGNLKPTATVPAVLPGLAAQGQTLYAELGCYHCHTQQVRVTAGSDIKRGWGSRQSMPLDYVGQMPLLAGSARVGPDLTTVGSRRPDAVWHYLHFYNPKIKTAGSNMPPFDFLFETREIVGEGSSRALQLEGDFAPEPGYEVVPTRDAEALVAYMLSLKAQTDLREAPTVQSIGLEE